MSDFERSDPLAALFSLNHDLFAVVHVDAGGGGLGLQAATVEGEPVVSGLGLGSGVGGEALDARSFVEDHRQAAGVLAAADEDVCLVGGHRRTRVAVEAEVLLIVDGGHAEDVEGASAEGRGRGVVIHATQVVGAAAVGREGSGGSHAHHVVVGHDDDGCVLGNLLALVVQRQLSVAVCGGIGAGVLVLVNGEAQEAVIVGGPVVAVGGLTGGEVDDRWLEGLAVGNGDNYLVN